MYFTQRLIQQAYAYIFSNPTAMNINSVDNSYSEVNPSLKCKAAAAARNCPVWRTSTPTPDFTWKCLCTNGQRDTLVMRKPLHSDHRCTASSYLFIPRITLSFFDILVGNTCGFLLSINHSANIPLVRILPMQSECRQADMINKGELLVYWQMRFRCTATLQKQLGEKLPGICLDFVCWHFWVISQTFKQG